MEQLVEAHGVCAKLLEVVGIVAQAHGHSTHDFFRELHNAVQVVHASLSERLSKRLGPYVRTMGKLLCLDLRVVHGQITRDIVALLEIGLGVGLDHLAVHDFVSAVVFVLFPDMLISQCPIVTEAKRLPMTYQASSFLLMAEQRKSLML